MGFGCLRWANISFAGRSFWISSWDNMQITLPQQSRVNAFQPRAGSPGGRLEACPTTGRYALALLTLLTLLTLPVEAADPFAEFIRSTGPRTPQEEAKGFHLPPGFEVQLVASEPEIGKPMNMTFDE